MKKRFPLFIAITAIIFSLAVWPTGVASAAIADGTYDIDYEIKEAGSNNTSIADGYFAKPAKLIVENGTNYVQLTVTSSEWIKSLSGPHGAVDVISEDKANNKRVVKFKAGDISQPVTLKMHIVVPEKIAGMKYDNQHTARAVFDVSGLGDGGAGAQSDSEKVVDNPPTGDNSSIALYVTLLVGSAAAIFIVRKLRPAQN